ncbi:GDSL-type esterase/lipase family protein [Microbacterium sp. BWT-B31]|uniref:SGNH/GDSL hydrolase family protein n=1 Tax=Microbacterium sp. BWT-B31 TaxID=3232072 RepID=UPI003526CA34
MNRTRRLRPSKKPIAFAATVAILALTAALSGCGSSETPAEAVDLTEIAAPPGIGDIDTIGVLGDSLSLGVNACGEVGRCTAASWASGDDPAVASIATRVAALTGTEPEVVNRAKDGGTVADAIGERSDEVIAAQPDLVLLFLGGNDVCKGDVASMTSVEDFRASYTDLLGRISAGAPDARVLALSVPDLGHLWQIGHDKIAATSVWDQSPSCRNLLGDAQATDAASVDRRAAVTTRNTELNAVIDEVCAAHENCISDAGAVFSYPFSADEISTVDFFHPSVAGQAAIAELAWNALAGATQ